MIEVDDSRVAAAIARLSVSVKDFRPALRSVGQDLVENIRLCFRDSKSPWGDKWADLSPVTIALRRKNSDKPLLDTGVLRNSFTQKVTANELTVGTNKVYAKTQQFGAARGQFGTTWRGAPIPWGNIPPRPFMPIDPSGEADLPPDWMDDVIDSLEYHIDPDN